MVAAPRDPLRLPAGLLVFPFVIGAALTLALAAALGGPVDLTWVLAALAVGVVLAAVVFATKWAERHPAHIAHAVQAAARPQATPTTGPALAATPVDPLAHIHAVETQGRRHRRACVNCGTMVKASSSECSNCGHQITFACKGCKTPIRLDWTNCPECGRQLP